jgi:hypothetical protein
MRFDDLFDETTWKPIRGCPGRYVFRGESRALLEQLLTGASEHTSSKARDKILVVIFDDGGGIISYARADGSIVHTLNTPAGMTRKLAQLEIASSKLIE